jgi:hypothetical protein
LAHEVPVDAENRFSLVAGGPFNGILRRLGLTGTDQFPTLRAAAVLALLAWLPPALLAAVHSLVDNSYPGREYFTDLTVPARYLIAIWAMVATERYADGRFVILTREFREAGLLSGDGLTAFKAALATADRRSSSALAEGIIVAAALFASGFVIQYPIAITGSSWEGAVVGGEVELSWAGAAARWVSNPLFLFLVLRWVWWFFVWAALLFRISRLPLQLIPTHPDRAAGLGFLAIYPSVFSGFAFALGCVIASNMLKELGLNQHEPEIVWFAIAGWLAINLVLFLGPLLVFIGPLDAAREQALLEYGRLATRQHLASRRKWIGKTHDEESFSDSAALPSTAELNASVQAVREMGYSPINRTAVMHVIIAAGLPMLAVVVTLVPLDDLVRWLLRKIL